MARKVIIDCDPGVADAVALCLALFDPRLEVLAVTAVGGRVPAWKASVNAHALVEHLDPPRMPRLGDAVQLANAPSPDFESMQGPDGLGNADLVSSRLHRSHLSEKLICDEVRAQPHHITILCLGPLTNLARAFQRDPSLPGMVGRLIIAGGSWQVIGDVTPAAEFNMHYDPLSAMQVFQSPTTKTLIPLEVTRRVALTLDFVDELPSEDSRAGTLLRRMVPFAFRAHRQTLGSESIKLEEVVAVVAALHPELFETVEMQGDVETQGELTVGATVFERRPNHPVRANMEVAVSVEAAAVTDTIVRGLQHAGEMT
jgi:inosine-uridine nucleoside N-ribohydrolase